MLECYPISKLAMLPLVRDTVFGSSGYLWPFIANAVDAEKLVALNSLVTISLQPHAKVVFVKMYSLSITASALTRGQSEFSIIRIYR